MKTFSYTRRNNKEAICVVINNINYVICKIQVFFSASINEVNRKEGEKKVIGDCFFFKLICNLCSNFTCHFAPFPAKSPQNNRKCRLPFIQFFFLMASNEFSNVVVYNICLSKNIGIRLQNTCDGFTLKINDN